MNNDIEDFVDGDQTSYTTYGMYDYVKSKIINLHYSILDNFSAYQSNKLYGKDNDSERRFLTTLLLKFWLQIKDYKKILKDDAFKKYSNLCSNTMDDGTVFTYKQICNSVKYFCECMVKIGLTDIQAEKNDPGKSVIQDMS